MAIDDERIMLSNYRWKLIDNTGHLLIGRTRLNASVSRKQPKSDWPLRYPKYPKNKLKSANMEQRPENQNYDNWCSRQQKNKPQVNSILGREWTFVSFSVIAMGKHLRDKKVEWYRNIRQFKGGLYY